MEYDVIEPRMLDQQERLERLFRYAQIGQCVSSVTHDVNNFLGAIMAYAELVAMDGQLPAESQRMINEILSAVRKASNLVNNLTDVSRRERPDVRVVDPVQCIERVLDLRRFDIRAHHISLKTDYAAEMQTFAVDLPKIVLALLYVLTNAIEAVSESDQPRSILITAQQDTEGVRIAISNSGDPIAPDQRETIFEPFVTSKTGQHLGLGLTMARQIAQTHSGELKYDPERGFVFYIPRSGLSLDPA